MEQAAIGGHVFARHNLGVVEEQNGNIERAVKHYIVAANLGFHLSMEALKKCYQEGMISKDDFASVLRAHQAALGAMKSPQRDEAKEAALRAHKAAVDADATKSAQMDGAKEAAR